MYESKHKQPRKMVPTNRVGSESDSDNELSCISLKPKRFGVLVSSEDEESNEEGSTAEKKTSESILENHDTLSLHQNTPVSNSKGYEDTLYKNKGEENSVKHISENSNSKLGFKFKLLSASDIESENESEYDGELTNENIDATKINGKLNDSGSNDEEDDMCIASARSKKGSKEKKTKPSNKIDKKLQIRSETQRMEREMSISLPYHRPKQRTLREFLSRKKNHLNADALRLSSGNMIHTWEAIDKSIKETAEFFKLESEDNNSVKLSVPLKCTADKPSVGLVKSPSQLTKDVSDVNLCMDSQPNEETETTDLIHESGSVTLGSEIQTLESPTIEKKVDANIERSEQLLAAENIATMDEVEPQNKTEAWLKDVAAFEKRENLRNKLQLSPSVLDKVPTLTTDAFVDLDHSDSESSELKPGAKLLMDRLLIVRKPTTKIQPTLKTTVTGRDDTGQVQNVSIEIVPFTQSRTIIDNGLNPGASLRKFREKLRNEIEAKWEEEYKKRCAENPIKPDFEENAESDEDLAYEGECDESTDEESEPEEEDVIVKDKPRRFCEFGNSEAEESEVDEDAPDDTDGHLTDEVDKGNEENESDEEPEKNVTESEELDCSLLPAFQPGGGLLMGGSILTQQSQPLPVHAYSPASSPAITQNRNLLTPVTASQKHEKQNETPRTPQNFDQSLDVKSVKKNLFGAEENTHDDSDDPFLFVSGAFPETAAAAPKCSQEPSPSQSKLKRILVMDDSDEDNDDALNEADDNRSLAGTENELDLDKRDSKPPTKKAAKLVFSDESECSEDENKREEEENSEKENDDDDIEYDSEENEVAKVRPGEFFEQEAELSESEWSGDEDEKGLDILEAEAGDADVLDEEQVASQLGRIHMRRVLDEDARDVRLLQELLLEDGDLHSDGKARDRKFRWKNLSAGFDLNGEHKDDDGSDGEAEASDAVLAKLRHEKTQFLMQLQQEGKLESFQEECSGKENSVLALGRQLLQRVRSGPLLSSTTSASKSVFARGSFLSKDEFFLSRLSRLATGSSDAPLGPSKSRNFVFAVQEKEVELEEAENIEGMKRKAISCKETVKRAKLIFDDQPSLLDQLR